MRRFTLACAGLLAVGASAIGGATAAVEGQQQSQIEARRAAIAWLGAQVYGYQRATWRWEALMGRQRTATEGRVFSEMSIPDVQRAVRLWHRRAAAARRKAAHPPHKAAWLCIHRYEGSWRDTGAPYYGGLQMDIGFQRTYGGDLLRRKGTANYWTPLEQMWVAERAHRTGRGYYPWPNTARSCGLI